MKMDEGATSLQNNHIYEGKGTEGDRKSNHLLLTEQTLLYGCSHRGLKLLSLSHCHSWLFPLMERIWTMMQNVLLPNTFGSFT